MDHLPQEFLQFSLSMQTKIVNIGLMCWKTIDKSCVLEGDALLSSRQLDQLFEKCKSNHQDLENQWSIERKHLKSEIEYLRQQNLQSKLPITIFQEMHQSWIAEFEKERSAQTNATNREINMLTKKISELEEFETKYKQLNATKSSYEIGKKGEAEIYEMLCNNCDYDIEHVANKAMSGDFRVMDKDLNAIIIDVKNYSRSVPTKECEKLMRDVDADVKIVGGILISCNSNICRRQHGTVEYTPANKPIIYLTIQNFDLTTSEQLIHMTLKILMKFGVTNQDFNRSDLLTALIKFFDQLKLFTKQTKTLQKMVDELKLTLDKNCVDLNNMIIDFEKTHL